jgi:hypothetical protein
MAKPINQMLSKQMSRKQFLANTGAAVVTMVGVSTVLKSFGLQQEEATKGYGSSTYGGAKEGR